MPGPPVPGLASWLEVDLPDGTTEAVGVDRYGGIWPESITASDDQHGSATLAFTIRRHGSWDNADLAGGNPIRYYHVIGGDGVLKWAGRIREDPESSSPTDFQLSVTCDGLQAQLDDDAHVAAWLISAFDAWADLRNAVVVDLNVSDPIDTWDAEGPASEGQVTINAGAKGGIQLAIPAGTALRGFQKVGVWLDSRSYPSLQEFYVELYRSLAGHPATLPLDLVIAGSPSPHFLAGSRVEYYRQHVTDLAPHHMQQIDPLVGVAPMPYIGIFLENVPPPASPPTPHVHSVTFASNDGASVATPTPGVQAEDGFAAYSAHQGDVALVFVTGGDDAGALTPPAGGLWSRVAELSVHPSSGGLAVTGNTLRTGGSLEVWGRVLSQGDVIGGGTWQWANAVQSTLALVVLRDTTPDLTAIKLATDDAPAGTTSLTASLTESREGAIYLAVAGYNSQNTPTISGSGGAAWDNDGAASVAYHGYTGNDLVIRGLAVWSDTTAANHHSGDTPHAHAVLQPEFSSPTDGWLALLSLSPDERVADLTTPHTYAKAVKILFSEVKLAPTSGLVAGTGESLLLPSRVASDVVALVPKLSSDVSLIDTSDSDAIEALVFATPTSPRQMIEAANAIAARRYRVEVDGRLRYDDLPATPLVEVGSWDGVTFNDASGQGIADTYNSAYLTGQDALGRAVLIKRGVYGSPELPGYTLIDVDEADVAGASPPDPWWSFVNDTPAGWAGALIGAASVASGRWELTNSTPWDGEGVAIAYAKLGEAFQVGVEYALTVRLAMLAGVSTDGVPGLVRASIYGGNYRYLAREIVLQKPAGSGGTPHDYVIDFIANHAWMHLYLIVGAETMDVAVVATVNQLGLQRVAASQLDARGLRRTKITSAQNALTAGVARKIADAFLRDSAPPTYKGSISITGPAARLYADHATPIPAADLLGRAGELVWLADRIDPLTGLPGRAARIVAVSYDDRNDTATVTLDNTRHDLDVTTALLAQEA